MRRSVNILGATGSVGRSTLDLIGRDPGRYEIVALTAHRDVAGLAAAARRFGARQAVIADPALLNDLRNALAGSDVEAAAGEGAVIDAAGSGADWTMAAIVGTAGLAPVMRALEGGGTVALANKEALVSAGALMTSAAAASGATLLPVDSEHNAVFQCFDRARPESVRRIILTASGGPFRTWPLERMRDATPAEACAHPNWSMGAKISVDSATLMNKGLELIEAFHLFPVGEGAIEIVVHPQSVVHSLVEYVDGSVLAQLGPTDMRVPIAHTLAWPERMETPCARLDLVGLGTLDFEAPDHARFPALGLARAALSQGGAKPAILNAANEIAVASFLESRVAFLDIASVVGAVLDRYDPPAPTSLDAVLDIDREARRVAAEVTGKIPRLNSPGFAFTVIAFLLVIGPLIFIHELGHYFAGRWFGVKADVFSIGFGRELTGWTDKRGTRWKIGWLPLGGYVKFAGDMNPASTPSDEWLSLPPEERNRTFQSKALWQRFIIVLAGPATNFLFAIVALMILFATIGYPTTPAVVGGVEPGSVAQRAGFQPGDRIVAVDGGGIELFAELQTYVALHPEEAMEFTVERGGGTVALQATPAAFVQRDNFGNEARIGRLGIMPSGARAFAPLPLHRLPGTAIGTTVDAVKTMVTALYQVVTGRRSVSELGGPLKIASVSGQQASLGWLPFFWLMVMVSINLGFINLLPIPLLDGGHLLFYTIEGVRRKPLRPEAQEWAFRTGLAVLLALMIFVTFNDLASFGLFSGLGSLIG